MPTRDDQPAALPVEPAPTPVKPGTGTSEFWLSLIAVGGPIAAAVIDMLLKSGKVQEGTPWHSVLLILAAVLAAMGYTVVRGIVKSSTAKADGEVRAAYIRSQFRQPD